MENKGSNKTDLGEILKTAFWYWNKTLIYQLVYSLLYFSLFFMGYIYLLKYFGLWDQIWQYSDLIKVDVPAFNKKMEEIARMPAARNFSLAFFLLLALINPLNVGLYNIFRKVDREEPISINDLFAGYLGLDFFKFFGFYLFWIIIFTYALALLILVPVWIFITLFSIPLLYFMNVKTFESISLTFKGLKKHFTTILFAMIVAFIFSLSGILLFGVGFLFTFPFWNAMIYALYQNLFTEID